MLGAFVVRPRTPRPSIRRPVRRVRRLCRPKRPRRSTAFQTLTKRTWRTTTDDPDRTPNTSRARPRVVRTESKVTRQTTYLQDNFTADTYLRSRGSAEPSMTDRIRTAESTTGIKPREDLELPSRNGRIDSGDPEKGSGLVLDSWRPSSPSRLQTSFVPADDDHEKLSKLAPPSKHASSTRQLATSDRIMCKSGDNKSRQNYMGCYILHMLYNF